jgi:excisionase family DNA binding protein
VAETQIPEYLTVVEFAAALRVDKTVVQGWIAKKVIRAINVGSDKRKRLRIPPSQFAVLEKARAV